MALPADVAGGAADGLDEGARRAQEAFLVGVQDGHQRHLGQVEALAQEVDAHEHVELAQAQVAQDLHPLEGVDVGVEVAHPHPEVVVVLGEVLGHALGEGGDEHALLALGPHADLGQEVVHLALDRPDVHRGVDEARWGG